MVKAGKSFSVIAAVALVLSLGMALCLPQPASAAEFHVTTAAEFQVALDAAENNGEDDVIYLAAGTYKGHFAYHSPTEHKSLTVRGEPGTSAEDVILDGQNSGGVLTFYHDDPSYTGPTADVWVNGLTIQNGLSSSSTGGIRARLWGEYNILITNCIIRNNSHPGHGAGVAVEVYEGSGNISLENNLILDNIATEREDGDSGGGGVAILHGSSGQTTIRNNVIANNSASGMTDPQGGGLWIRGAYNLIGNTVYNNQAGKGGGVYCWEATTANVYNNIIYENSATEGGDIYLTGITNRIGYNNDYSDMLGDWTESGSNLDVEPAFADPASDDYHLTDGSPCIDTGTTAVPDPPGLPATDIEGKPRVWGAAPDMGAYERTGGEFHVTTAAEFQVALDAAENNGEDDVIYLAAGTYEGGFVYESLDTEHNSLTIRGEPGTSAEDIILDGQGEQRVLYISGDGTVTMEGFTVTNGVAMEKGAGLYAQNANLTLRDVTFYSNVISTTADYAYGSGAMVEGGTLLVSDCAFRANSAWAPQASYGGGLAISDSLTATVELSLFQDNDAWHASGLYFKGSAGNYTPLTVRRCQFLDNGWGNSPGTASGGYSGAMEIVRTSAQVEDNAFIHNYVSNDWGVISIWSSDLLLARNVIYDNTSHRVSGLCLDNVSPFTLANNLIVDNESTSDPVQSPCLHIVDSEGFLLHNTIGRNTGEYGIKVEQEATVAMANTILVGHTVGINVTEGSTATLEATLWGEGDWANGTDWSGDGSIDTGTINIWGDPAFMDPDGGDYHIGLSSAAIDAGTTTVPDPPGLPATDIEGNPRVSGAAPDMGAYEAWDPWVYDEDSSGTIEKMEAIHAVQDYFDGEITKAQAIEVVMLYFG